MDQIERQTVAGAAKARERGASNNSERKKGKCGESRQTRGKLQQKEGREAQ